MTLDGTNTWVLAEPGADRAVVVDPGPDDRGHLDAVLTAATEGGRRVGLILLTHRHPDHMAGAAQFARTAAAPIRAADPTLRSPGSAGLDDGDRINLDGLDMLVLATPGHTSDSVCFLLPADRAVLTGDTVLGRGTTVVAHPDGRLGDYLESLQRLQALARDRVDVVYPGHGPVLPDAEPVVETYLNHRQERLAQVRAAVAAGARGAHAVVEVVYADVDPVLWPAAEWSVRAQLEYLGLPF
jgi:glyoxylase-like metal-dependent hydrolase (beta-lactamase superfamily II)